MPQQPTIYVGTIGQSVWRSLDGGDLDGGDLDGGDLDGGESWKRASNGIFPEADIRAISINLHDPNMLYAGTEAGIYRSTDGAESWALLDSPMNNVQIWSLAINPRNPNIVFAGTCPSALYRSQDGGVTWQKLTVELAPDCGPDIPVIPRFTTIIIDPEDDQTIYAGIEIDGMRTSRDGGDTWVAGSHGLSSLDIHRLAVVPGSPKMLVAATNNDVCELVDSRNAIIASGTDPRHVTSNSYTAVA